MSYDPEEELLDHNLRESFSEFELPPAHRIWEGIEGQVGVLPKASQPLMTLRFLLPAAVLAGVAAGVAAGWLLSRPVPTLPAAKTPVARVVPATSAVSKVVVAMSSVASVPVGSVVVASSGRRLAAVPARPTERRIAAAPVVPLAAQLPALAMASALAPTALVVPAADSNAAAILYASAAPATPAASGAGVAQVAAAETSKADGPQSFHAEFRQPTHRRAERGRGIRRRLSAVAQWARHLVSPHRVRTTGQPSF